jgi:two-component system response regulator YesN
MKYKVVIIDDEPWTREVIKALGAWDELGLEVVGEASDGEYGLELIRLTLPDIILTDVNMPNLNGIEMIETLRRENNNTSVIFISGYDDYTYIRSAMKLNTIDYLLKPIKPEELNKQLGNCIKLQKEKNEIRNGIGGLESGFLDAEWAGKYYELRDNLFYSLNSQDINIIKHKFNEMNQLITDYEGENIAKGIVVCIYYNLMNTLEHFIISRNFMTKEILKDNNTTFIFSKDSALKEMLLFVQNLYCITSEQMQEYNRNRNRLDVGKIKSYVRRIIQME